MPAASQYQPGKEFSPRISTDDSPGENSSRSQSTMGAGKGSFDSVDRLASESIHSAQDDKEEENAEEGTTVCSERW
jgi:hypothetical protein